MFVARYSNLVAEYQSQNARWSRSDRQTENIRSQNLQLTSQKIGCCYEIFVPRYSNLVAEYQSHNNRWSISDRPTEDSSSQNLQLPNSQDLSTKCSQLGLNQPRKFYQSYCQHVQHLTNIAQSAVHISHQKFQLTLSRHRPLFTLILWSVSVTPCCDAFRRQQINLP